MSVWKKQNMNLGMKRQRQPEEDVRYNEDIWWDALAQTLN